MGWFGSDSVRSFVLVRLLLMVISYFRPTGISLQCRWRQNEWFPATLVEIKSTWSFLLFLKIGPYSEQIPQHIARKIFAVAVRDTATQSKLDNLRQMFILVLPSAVKRIEKNDNNITRLKNKRNLNEIARHENKWMFFTNRCGFWTRRILLNRRKKVSTAKTIARCGTVLNAQEGAE